MSVTWRAPWQALPESGSGGFALELKNELCAKHVLFGITVRAIGRDQGRDDILFELLDGSRRLAVVHLTYARHPEPDPEWPETDIYDDWEHFATARMNPDAVAAAQR